MSGRLLPRGDWDKWHQALEQAKDLQIREKWSEAGRKNITNMGLTPNNQANMLSKIFDFSEEE